MTLVADKTLILEQKMAASLIERAVLTLFSMPDREKAILSSYGGAWPDIVRSAEQAYGYAPPRVRKFIPTPRDVSLMLPVWEWLNWLSRRSKNDYKLVVAAALGAPWHVLARRFDVSERTIRRWRDNAIHSIAAQFEREVKLFGDCRG